MGRFMIPCCCVCGTTPMQWNDKQWNEAGGTQDFCPDHATQSLQPYISMNYNTRLCSAFPGTGKTYFSNHSDKKVIDSDSSLFNKNKFPQNYIEHIKQKIGHVDIIFISSHETVRRALVENNLKFTLIYPDINLKEEYLQRYKNRDNKKAFIKLLDKNWNEWITQMQNQNECKHLVLKSGEYISDVLD